MATNTKISIRIFDHKVFEYSNIRPISACFAKKELINTLFAVKCSYCCFILLPVNLNENNVSENFVSKVLRFQLIDHLLNIFFYEACSSDYTTEILLKMT